MWDEAVVACQFHELNVVGSNPSPTKCKKSSLIGRMMISKIIDKGSNPFSSVFGCVAEWFKAFVLKANIRKYHRFKSCRILEEVAEWL
jgi:hypothetical protein